MIESFFPFDKNEIISWACQLYIVSLQLNKVHACRAAFVDYQWCAIPIPELE